MANIWIKIKEEFESSRVGFLPGLVIIALVIVARLTGVLQFLELVTFDAFLRLRPPEPLDERIVIVGINEEDIQNVGTYPIPDGEIAALLRTLQKYNPTVIGLDVFRDLPIEPGHAELTATFRESKNLIAIEKALPDLSGFAIAAPRSLPAKQLGFADVMLDRDGYLRRSLLGTYNLNGEYKFSLSIRLAEAYLASQGVYLDNGIRDPIAMRFGSTELTRFQPNSGSYIRADANGNQVLLNFRSGRKPFRVLSLNDIKTGKFEPSWIRDRIVLIGVTALSAKDTVNSAAIAGVNPGLVYGVEIQAHAASQIISAVLDKRSLINVWSDGWEYLWIFSWGVLGISLARSIQSPWKSLLGIGVASVGLVGACYGLLILGWWIPVLPALLTLVLNGVGLAAFYRYEQSWVSRLQERQLIIDHTFDTIHNGPLQTLAKLLRNAQDEDLPPQQLLPELQRLNQELRAVYESIRRETLTQESCLSLGSDLELDLQDPTHELLYEVYRNTIERDFPCFKTLKVKVTKFEPIDSKSLSIEQKRGLCRFLEEALCNVGKYAIGVTRLEVICKQEQGQTMIRVTDNGIGLSSLSNNSNSKQSGGRGTQQAKTLARQLGGTFQRSARSPKGTICELTWSVKKNRVLAILKPFKV